MQAKVALRGSDYVGLQACPRYRRDVMDPAQGGSPRKSKHDWAQYFVNRKLASVGITNTRPILASAKTGIDEIFELFSYADIGLR